MVNLDTPTIFKRLDTENMRAQLHGLPEQCWAVWNKARKFELPYDYIDIDKIVFLGMGGSAIGGDLVRGLVSSTSKLIIIVNTKVIFSQ